MASMRVWVSVTTRGEGPACCAGRRAGACGAAGSSSSSSSGGGASSPSSLLVGRRGRRASLARNVSARVSQANDEEQLENILNTIRGAEALDTDPDFYTLLGIEAGAAPNTIKQAYRDAARKCHPDVAGEDGHEACIYLNEAYATLMDDDLRATYDVERENFGNTFKGLASVMRNSEFADALSKKEYTAEPLSKMMEADHFACKMERDDPKVQAEQMQKAVFVDEISCIGCKNCANAAPGVFRMEKDHGRARVFGQWLNTEDEIQEAIDTCPSDCIHWVPLERLAPLEYVMRYVLRERLNVGLMRAGQGRHKLRDVFVKTAQFVKAMTQDD